MSSRGITATASTNRFPGKTRGKRVYARAFDYEEAQTRYDAGESLADLAAEYHVTRNAIWQVVTEAGRRTAEVSRAHQRERTIGQGVCIDCGGPMNAASRKYNGAERCIRCATLQFATSVRADELWCNACETWKPDEDFPHDHRKIARRGRHRQCRACNTRLRQEYRERHKVPCVGCGRPTLPPNEKRTNGSGKARCSSCASWETAVARGWNVGPRPMPQ